MKPSKLDVAAHIHRIGSFIPDADERSAFTHLAVSKCASGSLYSLNPVKKLKVIRDINVELEQKGWVLLECDKSGRFGVLPECYMV